ncbi:DUF4136 domain-containing protein [Sphingomonas ginkgonis]|uniref:DUF4136 domain-containing protein n=1 Tax=Sphingomonas ginkgonis TaxID=2315330 RepID=A0A3S0ELW8_9SPHN|nr:DUF4136 domain-containing protein [Sphingomonas ginkgonis]RST30549.1 DUF4136 domain-containing protein [Sphingomonas ginkgonis]
MISFKKVAAALAISVAGVGLSGCVEGLPAKVTRYNALPIPAGQSFFVVPDRGTRDGLEFQRYAGLVAQNLSAQGFAPAANPQSAQLIVQVGYHVDRGTQRLESDPFPDPFYDPFYRGFYGRPFYSRFGGYYGGFRSPFYYGWNDPFWYGRGVTSYIEYRSELDMAIRSRTTNQPLFDGRAVARSTTDELAVLVPNLVQAMFTGFPGRSGETVRITVPPPGRRPR